ncbi:unnamed protein product, partial [Adineta ricciae]
SNLQCFYNQSCVSTLQSYFTGVLQFNATALDSSLTSQYSQNSTIQDLLNYLMVEEWDIRGNYTSYYADCRPSQCVYTYTVRNGILYIATTLIGLLGGLITFLRLLVPRIVKFFVRCVLNRKRVVPYGIDT